MISRRALVSLTFFVLALAPVEAHTVSPTLMNVRPGATEYVYVADQGTCPADITITSPNPNKVKVYAINMFTGTLIPGNGTSATVLDRVDQLFLVQVEDSLAAVGSTILRVCWKGQTQPNLPCPENNCPNGVPVTVVVNPWASTSDSHFASGIARDPVDTSTGEFFLPEPFDLNLGGPLPLGFGRYYASGLLADGVPATRMGPNWRHEYDWTLSVSSNVFLGAASIEIVSDTGRLIRFERPFLSAAWTLVGNEAIPYQLIESVTEYVLGDPSTNLIRRFDTATRQLTSSEDRNGNTLTLSYAAGLLSTITDGTGRTLTLGYDGSNRVSSVTDGTRTVTYTYDAGGNLATYTDAAGGVTTYAYDAGQPAAALMTSKTFPEGNTQYVQVFDVSGRVTTQTDADGNPWTFAYGPSTNVTDPLGGVMGHDYNADSELTGTTDEAGESASMQYDAKGRRTSITDRFGKTTTWTWHQPSGKVKSITNADGSQTTYTFGSQVTRGITFWNVTKIDLADGGSVSFSYDPSGNLTSSTDAAGGVWTRSFNAAGQPLTATNPLGGVTSFSYNADGTPSATTDDAGNLTTIAYDALRRPVLVTRPDTATASFTYDPLDQLLTSTDELGGVTTYVYDANGNVVSLTTPEADTWTFSHDDLDRTDGFTDPLGNSVAFAYDQLGRVSLVTNQTGDTQAFAYDSLSSLIGVTDELGNPWSQTFDLEGVIASKTSPLGHVRTFASDAMGRITRDTSPLGNEVRYSYDSMGRLAQVRDPLGRSTNFTWGPAGNLQSIDAPGSGVTATYGHDAMGLLTSATVPGGGVWQYAYDDQARRTTNADPLGNVTTFQYDARSNVDSITLPGGIGLLDLEHDARGLVTRKLFPDGTDLVTTHDGQGRVLTTNNAAFGYDAAGRMKSSNGFTFTRDQVGRLTSVTLAAGKTITYTYDAGGDLATVTDWVGGTTTLTYDADRRLTSILRPNLARTAFEYDADGRLTRTFDEDPLSAGNLADHVLTRNARGRITDAVRLQPQEATPAVGTTNLSFDAASQVTGFTYDAMGRLEADGVRTYTWNDASRLTGYTEGGNTVTFAHDGFALMRSRTEGGVTRRFVWNYALGSPAISVVRQGGTDLRYYVYTPGGSLLHGIEAADDSRHFFHYDEAGNTTCLTDDAGAVANAYAYSPHGVLLAQTGVQENPFTFRGREGVMTEGSSGMYCMRARFYDAVTARFISRDPVELPGPHTGNPYQYAYGDPLSFTDPSGLTGTRINSMGGGVKNVTVLDETNIFDLPSELVKWGTWAGVGIGHSAGSATAIPGESGSPGRLGFHLGLDQAAAAEFLATSGSFVSGIELIGTGDSELFRLDHSSRNHRRVIRKFKARWRKQQQAARVASLLWSGLALLNPRGVDSGSSVPPGSEDSHFDANRPWATPFHSCCSEPGGQGDGMFFFDPGNLTNALRVLDGCNLNERFWVFAGSLTAVEVSLTVTDTDTGETRNYFNPRSAPLPAITDTAAFNTCP